MPGEWEIHFLADEGRRAVGFCKSGGPIGLGSLVLWIGWSQPVEPNQWHRAPAAAVVAGPAEARSQQQHQETLVLVLLLILATHLAPASCHFLSAIFSPSVHLKPNYDAKRNVNCDFPYSIKSIKVLTKSYDDLLNLLILRLEDKHAFADKNSSTTERFLMHRAALARYQPCIVNLQLFMCKITYFTCFGCNMLSSKRVEASNIKHSPSTARRPPIGQIKSIQWQRTAVWCLQMASSR